MYRHRELQGKRLLRECEGKCLRLGSVPVLISKIWRKTPACKQTLLGTVAKGLAEAAARLLDLACHDVGL